MPKYAMMISLLLVLRIGDVHGQVTDECCESGVKEALSLDLSRNVEFPECQQLQMQDPACQASFQQCCQDQIERSACQIGFGLASAKSSMLEQLVRRLPLGKMHILKALLPHCSRKRMNLESNVLATFSETCCICKHVEDHVLMEDNSAIQLTKTRMCKSLGCCSNKAKEDIVDNFISNDEPNIEESEAVQESVINGRCGRDFRWDAEKNICVREVIKCPRGFRMNLVSGICEPRDASETDCGKGFTYNEDLDSCQDIDECKVGSHNCTEGQFCTNIVGSYRCMRKVPCGFGYTLNEATQICEDVDECKVDPTICGSQMVCKNVRGSYLCNRKDCQDHKRHDNNGKCTLCVKGYEIHRHESGDPLLNSCVDVDECTTGKAQCKTNEICVNKDGSYQCKPKLDCMVGTRLNRRGSNCDGSFPMHSTMNGML
ncbi:Anaphylotoxin-like domain [Cichlidogyrus casuarinus]|uniref:Anaphylotoxin-like domain n=1 Tax=Cichlidogyrus casuarinus TaxID=1844966 RepID=A0ABD2Q1G0_9PLAT